MTAFATRIACLLLALWLTACATRGDRPVRHTADGRICPQSFDFALADMPGSYDAVVPDDAP
jgi:hypothetical protein